MMNKKNSLIFLLSAAILAVSVTGCSSKKKEKEPDNMTEAIEENTGDWVFKIGKDKISYEEAIYYSLMLKQKYEPEFGEDIWDFEVEDGKTFEQKAKEEVLDEITQVKIINMEAKKEKVSLDDMEKADAENIAAEHFAEIKQEDIDRFGITEELLKTIYEEHALAAKMYEMKTLNVDTEVSNQEARQLTTDQIMVSTISADEEGNYIPPTKEEKDAALKKAKQLLKEVKKADDFKAFAEKNTDDSTVTYTFGKGDMDPAVEKAAFALKQGEISPIVEAADGYYILYLAKSLDEDATAEKKESIIAQRQMQEFSSLYNEWVKEYEVTVKEDVWESISFKHLTLDSSTKSADGLDK